MRKLAEQCCKYGNANQAIHPPLARASTYFGTTRNSIEKERENLLKILGDQVISSPSISVRVMITYGFYRSHGQNMPHLR